MTPDPLPDDPMDLLPRLWAELAQACADRQHGWRTPVLATLGRDDLPQARTVVLRGADPVAGTLAVFTDARSPKVAELVREPLASLVFWSAARQWQLRVQVQVVVHRRGELVEQAWEQVKSTASARDYLSANAPGAAWSPDDAGEQRPDHQLAVLLAQVQTLDWLQLSRDGHRRAHFAGGTGSWRVP